MTRLPQAGDAGPELLLALLSGHHHNQPVAAMDFTPSELDLLYECVRLQANALRRRQLYPGSPELESGSWADRLFQLDARLSRATCFHRTSLG
jgi:hypothetical protein